jgi:hypothetical protein
VQDQVPVDLDSARLNKLPKAKLIELLVEKEQALQAAIIGERIFHLTIRRFDVEIAIAHHRKGQNHRQRAC